jgi:hypothetical protein
MRSSEDLANKMTTERKASMDQVVAALQGTKATPEVPGSVTATQADVNDREMGPAAASPIALGQQLATGGGMGEGANIGAPAKAAVPGSLDAAQAMMMASKFPDLQAAGLSGMVARQAAKDLQPPDVKGFQFAQTPAGGGFSGTFEEWKKTGKGADVLPAAPIQNYARRTELAKQFGENSPEVARFDNYVRQLQTANLGGSIAIIDPTNPTKPAANLAVTPKPEEDPDFKRKQAEQIAIGKTAGEMVSDAQKKALNAISTLNNLDGIESLIDKSTGSMGGAALDAMSSFFGYAPEGAIASGKLKVLQAGLMLTMPRMEGPQSDRDVALYREASAQIGDPTVPGPIKKAAVETIREIQKRYQTSPMAGAPGTAQPNPANQPPSNFSSPSIEDLMIIYGKP